MIILLFNYVSICDMERQRQHVTAISRQLVQKRISRWTRRATLRREELDDDKTIRRGCGSRKQSGE
jgi:hypothetical protein